MTELFINNTLAVLPETFSFTLNEENPEMTKRGEYSYDITLSLESSINARIFKHINRRNSRTLMKEADAILIVDNHSIYGKIIDIENSDNDVTFQFVANNSEMNYDSTEKKIHEYDWGTEAFTYSSAFSSVQAPIYTKRYACFPVKFPDMITNEPVYISTDKTILNSIKNITINPYLIYYINKLPEVFGYTMNNNVLSDDELLKIMVMPNMVRSFKYSDFLPDMTVSDFITAIEEFFNVSFNFSSKNKTLDIVSNTVNLSNKKRVNASIEDTYKRELNETSDIFNFKKLSYTISSDGVNKFICIPDDIRSICTYTDVETFNDLGSIITDNDKNKFIIYRIISSGNQYIYGDATETNYFRQLLPGKTGFLYRVNVFEAYDSGNEYGGDFNLKIAPASIIPIEFTANGYVGDFPNGQTKTFKFTTQICSGAGSPITTTEQGLINALDSSLVVIPRLNQIEIVLYKGYCKILGMVDSDTTTTDYPITFTHINPVFWLPSGFSSILDISKFLTNLQSSFFIKCDKDIQLKTIISTYRPENLIDSSLTYLFNVIKNDIKTDDILVYDGAEYIPISFEKQITKKGAKKKFTGKFYKLRT